MAKYSGSWYKGFASTFNPIAGINLGLQWKEKKKAQKKIDDAVEQLKINSMNLAAKFDAARADGSISQEEYGDAMSWALPLGKEIMGKTKELYNNYQDMTPDQLQSEIDNINAVLDFSKELNFTNIEEMKAFGKKLTQPDAKMQWDLIIKSIENRKNPAQPEVFPTAEALRAKYPEAGVRYTEQGYVPTFGEVTPSEAPKTPGITDYNSAINYLSKFVNAPIDTFNKIKAGFQSQFPNIDLSAVTQESLREPEKVTGMEKPRVTSLPQLEGYREKILDADTWEDAQKIINDYTEAGYDPAQLGVTQQDWVNIKKSDLDNLVAVLNEITAGTPEGRNVKGNKKFAFEINGKPTEKTGAEWYKQVYESYIALLKLLEEAGVDTSQYKKLKPLSEIKKIKFGGFVGSGVETGDLTFIYY